MSDHGDDAVTTARTLSPDEVEAVRQAYALGVVGRPSRWYRGRVTHAAAVLVADLGILAVLDTYADGPRSFPAQVVALLAILALAAIPNFLRGRP